MFTDQMLKILKLQWPMRSKSAIDLLEKWIFLLSWQNFEIRIHANSLVKKIHFSSSSMAPSSSTWLEKSLSEIRPSLNISGVSTYLVLTRVELRGKSEWSRCFFFACGHWHKANIFADDHGRVLVRFCWSLRGFMWCSTWVIWLFILLHSCEF